MAHARGAERRRRMIFSDSCRVCRRRIGEDGFCENEDCGMHWKQMYGQTFDALERKEKEKKKKPPPGGGRGGAPPPPPARGGGDFFFGGNKKKKFPPPVGRGFRGV